MPTSPVPEARTAAPLAALADRCVQCGLCLPHCPTYRLDAHEAESPRGRIAYAKALATGQIEPSVIGDRHLDHCLACRRCESVCPAGVEYGALLIQARAAQFARQPATGPGRWQLNLLARPRRLNALLGLYRRLYSLLPRIWRILPKPPRSQALARASGPEAVAVFVGCVADAYESSTRAALSRLLASIGIATVVPSGQTCCGAAALHAGDTAQAQALALRNRTTFSTQTRALSLASGCQEALSESLNGLTSVQDALTFLDSHAEGLRFRSAGHRRVAVHLPCTQRNVTRTEPALRRLLARVPDLTVSELPDTGCCGAAGLHMLRERTHAEALRAPLLDALHELGASELLSANVGCRLHLANGTRVPVRHPIDFLAEHLA
jgi:glycolate oxidase iron-sulfur subunit